MPAAILPARQRQRREITRPHFRRRAILSRFRDDAPGGPLPLSRCPLEFRDFLWSDLRDLQSHIENTMVPAQLGNAEMMNDLLGTLTRTQMIVTDQVPHETRMRMREATYTATFRTLWHAIDELSKDQRPVLFNTLVGDLQRTVPAAIEAARWFENDDRPRSPTRDEAARLIATGQAMLKSLEK